MRWGSEEAERLDRASVGGQEMGGDSGGTQGSELALHVPPQAPSLARPSSASITSPQAFWISSEASLQLDFGGNLPEEQAPLP